MIMVDIQVPVLDQIYDFELEEDWQTGMVLEDILILIAQNAGVSIEEREAVQLYSMVQEKILKRGKTLRQQNIRDGDRLILI